MQQLHWYLCTLIPIWFAFQAFFSQTCPKSLLEVMCAIRCQHWLVHLGSIYIRFYDCRSVVCPIRPGDRACTDWPVFWQTKTISAFRGCLAQIMSRRSQRTRGRALCFQLWSTGLTFTESSTVCSRRLSQGSANIRHTALLGNKRQLCSLLVADVNSLVPTPEPGYKAPRDIAEGNRCYINKPDFSLSIDMAY